MVPTSTTSIAQDGLLATCEAGALKRVVTWQLAQEMKRRRISRTTLAGRMKTPRTSITALTTKAEDWRYEQEVRFIYDLEQSSGQLVCENGHHLVPIPPEALREIIVGFRAKVELVREIVRLFRAGQIGKPELFFAGCHPNLYEVQAHRADDKYLLDYFEIVRPSR